METFINFIALSVIIILIILSIRNYIKFYPFLFDIIMCEDSRNGLLQVNYFIKAINNIMEEIDYYCLKNNIEYDNAKVDRFRNYLNMNIKIETKDTYSKYKVLFNTQKYRFLYEFNSLLSNRIVSLVLYNPEKKGMCKDYIKIIVMLNILKENKIVEDYYYNKIYNVLAKNHSANRTDVDELGYSIK